MTPGSVVRCKNFSSMGHTSRLARLAGLPILPASVTRGHGYRRYACLILHRTGTGMTDDDIMVAGKTIF